MGGVVGVIGAGRVGAGLALALSRAGRGVRLISRRPVSVPAPLSLTVAPEGPDAGWVSGLDVLILAVPDGRIHPVAQQLWATRGVNAGQTVLHCSGVLGQEALSALVPTRAALGSLHPLQTINDPEVAPERFKGAWAAVEGSPAAMETAEGLARAVGMKPFRITGKAKILYHAGAVFASNYLVVVEAIAQRLLRHAGLPDDEAWAALSPLVRGTITNLLAGDPRNVLTGPVARGDTDTILRHLSALTLDDARLYQMLGRAALELARKNGMDDETAQRVADALATDLPPVLPPRE
ncbi:MAG TPA: Rossmann-like and DUF2520 domain-containing protein [Gemmatimonadales bacterium]|nr:Rossmann-like and DUF2520 domain-containing protein [Gemmatimonadales bacterium]